MSDDNKTTDIKIEELEKELDEQRYQNLQLATRLSNSSI